MGNTIPFLIFYKKYDIIYIESKEIRKEIDNYGFSQNDYALQ